MVEKERPRANDLLKAALEKAENDYETNLDNLIDAATQAGASHAFVSGSGPSVVAFAADEAAAQRIIDVWRDTAVVDRIIRAKSPAHPNIGVRQ